LVAFPGGRQLPATREIKDTIGGGGG